MYKSDIYERETTPCNFAAETIPPESAAHPLTIPIDSEWAGFSLEMALILSEVEL